MISRRQLLLGTASFAAALAVWPRMADASAYSTAVLAQSPVVYFKMGEPSGTSATDSSGNGHTGTYSGTITEGIAALMVGDTATSVFYNGGVLDSGVDAACTPGAGDFSVEVWVQITSPSVNVLAGKISSGGTGDNYWLGANTNKAVFSVNASTVTSAVSITNGATHHLVGVRDAGTLRLYVDGVADGTAAIAGTCNPPSDLFFAQFGADTALKAIAIIGHGAYYASKLTPAQVLQHYQAGTGTSGTLAASPATIDPHTTGIVLTLTGTSTAWDGSTVFTVAGGGATKTAQNVISATSATVTVTTSTTSGSTSITETVTGSGFTTIAVLPYKKILVTTGGVDVMILEPASYVGGSVRFIYYHHGSSEDRLSLLTDTLKTGCLNSFLAAGYLLAGLSSGNDWGNSAALSAYDTVYTYMQGHYTIAGTLIWCQSMGGMSGLLKVSAGSYPDLKGWLGTYPTCNLADMYAGTLQAAIQSAYNIPGGGTYATQTAGHDPVLLSASGFHTFMRFYASPADTLVNKTNNSDQMHTLVASVATESVVVVCSGDHGDPSHFQPSDYLAFVTRAFAPGVGRGANFFHAAP